MTIKTNDMTQVHSVLYGRRWQNFLKKLTQHFQGRTIISIYFLLSKIW